MTRLVSLLASALIVVAATCAQAQDFDNDGLRDTVIGVPGEDHSLKTDAGAVNVIYGGDREKSRTQQWTLASPGVLQAPADNDRFGAAVAWGRFNADSYDDLAIGIPGRNVGFQPRAGAVLIIYGGPGGLVADPNLGTFVEAPLWIVQGQNGIPGQPKIGDEFGFSLATGRVPGHHMLVMGAPGVSAGDLGDQGRGEVVVWYPSTATWPVPKLLTQMIGGTPEPGDFYGFSVETEGASPFVESPLAPLAIGVPGEDTDGEVNAGAVEIRYLAPDGYVLNTGELLRQSDFTPLPQGDAYFGFSLAMGLLNGDDYCDLVIGEPLHDFGVTKDAGVIRHIYSSETRMFEPATGKTWAQGVNLPGVRETGDYFGFSVAIGYGAGGSLVAVGAPGENVQVGELARTDAGSVHVIRTDADGLTKIGAQMIESTSVSRLGWSLQFGGDFLFMGAPETSDWRGAVRVYLGVDGPGPLTPGWTSTQTAIFPGTELSEQDDLFGFSLGAGPFPL
jgi:hypothetical protein